MLEESARIQQRLLKGQANLWQSKDGDTGTPPRELVYKQDKVEVYHYRPEGRDVVPVPLVVVYALVNRQYMMDIQQDRSLFKKMLDRGIELYVVDWGYPSKADKYLSMEDYIAGYMNDAVDFARDRGGVDKVNVLGVCQGGTFSLIYSALFPAKVRNLGLLAAPGD